MLVACVALFLASAASHAAIVYTQPPRDTGGLIQSSWWDPDGSDWDMFCWDAFLLSSPATITEIHWRGGFAYGGSYGGPVVGFTIALYPSIAAGTEPDVVHPPLFEYFVAGDAGQTAVGTFGGTAMYDYQFVLPAPFEAAADTRYWVQLYAWQHGVPEWGVAAGTGGDGSHYRHLSEYMFQFAPGDFAMTLLGPGPERGDLNCDGVLNVFDIDPFVLALSDPAGYEAAQPDCDGMLADINADGAVNAFDIDPFVALLAGG